jgi:16S rRNA (guanine527-N7)-methyltransferase
MSASSDRLNQLLTQSNSQPLILEQSEKFTAYLTLLQKWNAHTNLTAIRDEEGILSRHFLESILCARTLPAGIQTLLDFGSGAGFPGLPIAILRPEIAVTLAESQNKKAAFLREAIRALGVPAPEVRAQVHSARAEELKTRFDCVTLRAVDNMQAAIPAAIQLLAPGGLLAILTTTTDAPTLQSLAGNSFHWQPPIPLPANTNRILLCATRSLITV